MRKPGAFENYRYRDDLFPTSRFRMAYDQLKGQHTVQKASKEYLRILYCAAKESESLVDEALRSLFELGVPVYVDDVEMMVRSWMSCTPSVKEVSVSEVDLGMYDELLGKKEAV